ncbi:hypothetical protein IFM89_000376 [Coptis chinensis]|uniref:Probable DNA helicase MCM8 n=1 Tax=Coptis chinensis TaxID=261450 RepID=A0A835HC65_9MAGN|nr:hypothetical protein IFM89_000376 [Coptis chinensis]
MFEQEEERADYTRINIIPKIWPTYFPQTEFSYKDSRLKLINELTHFFSSTPPGQLVISQVKNDGALCLPLDFQHFQKTCGVNNFYASLDKEPKEALSIMCVAIHKVMLMKSQENIQFLEDGKVNVRLHNCPDSMMIALKNLKAAYIGKLVCVRGTVVKVSTVKPLVIHMDFSCAKCGSLISRVFPDGKFSPPTTCIIQGCKSRTFCPIRNSARPIDFQKIRIQELLRSENHEEGRVPRTVECELTEDLVDVCIPGDVVTVTGIIKVINNYMDVGGGKSKNKNQGLYYLYLEAVSVKNSKSQSRPEDSLDSSADPRATELFDLYSFSPRDLEFIVKFSEEHGSDVFRQILQSICPSIYGHELVKAGITLALFGGVRKHSMDQNKVPVRGDIHVIVVGDPGLGKSQLLQAAASVSPRGIYICGNATTNAGLTVAVVKDPMTGDYAFEAGAMVLADRGLCCIDEFDKMSAEHQALLEAMEQQCVSVAKAGLVASLSARTSVLAAANPVGEESFIDSDEDEYSNEGYSHQSKYADPETYYPSQQHLINELLSCFDPQPPVTNHIPHKKHRDAHRSHGSVTRYHNQHHPVLGDYRRQSREIHSHFREHEQRRLADQIHEESVHPVRVTNAPLPQRVTVHIKERQHGIAIEYIKPEKQRKEEPQKKTISIGDNVPTTASSIGLSYTSSLPNSGFYSTPATSPIAFELENTHAKKVTISDYVTAVGEVETLAIDPPAPIQVKTTLEKRYAGYQKRDACVVRIGDEQTEHQNQK